MLDKTDELIKHSSVKVVLLTEQSFEDISVEMVLKSCYSTGEANQVPKPIVYVVIGETDTNALPRGISMHLRSAKKIMWRKKDRIQRTGLQIAVRLDNELPKLSHLLTKYHNT